MKKKNTLHAWRRKKAGIIGALVVVSGAGALFLQLGGTKWILIPLALALLMIWVLGEKIYVCPHCKTPIDLRLHLHADTKCTKCGRSIME